MNLWPAGPTATKGLGAKCGGACLWGRASGGRGVADGSQSSATWSASLGPPTQPSELHGMVAQHSCGNSGGPRALAATPGTVAVAAAGSSGALCHCLLCPYPKLLFWINPWYQLASLLPLLHESAVQNVQWRNMQRRPLAPGLDWSSVLGGSRQASGASAREHAVYWIQSHNDAGKIDFVVTEHKNIGKEKVTWLTTHRTTYDMQNDLQFKTNGANLCLYRYIMKH